MEKDNLAHFYGGVDFGFKNNDIVFDEYGKMSNLNFESIRGELIHAECKSLIFELCSNLEKILSKLTKAEACMLMYGASLKRVLYSDPALLRKLQHAARWNRAQRRRIADPSSAANEHVVGAATLMDANGGVDKHGTHDLH